MFITSDSRLGIPGMTSLQIQDKFHFHFHHGHLGGVAVCNNTLSGRKGWYWTQAVTFAQAQRTMTEDQWMSNSGDMETEDYGASYYKPEDHPFPDLFQAAASGAPIQRLNSLQTHQHDYSRPFVDSTLHWAPTESQPPLCVNQFSPFPSHQEPTPQYPDTITFAEQSDLPSSGTPMTSSSYVVDTSPVSDAAYTFTVLSGPNPPDHASCYSSLLMDDGENAAHESYAPASPFRQSRWAEQRATISPKVLRRGPSPNPGADPGAAHRAAYSDSGPARTGTRSEPSSGTPKKTRRSLPGSVPKSPGVSAPETKSGLAARARRRRRATPEPKKRSRLAVAPRTATPPAAPAMGTADNRNSSSSGGGDRSAKDDFLVRSKLGGMTYREIRVRGGFTEAESTLRGRFRALTKSKEARVRKPEWNEGDIVLLGKAVRKYCKGQDAAYVKVPWKQVAEYIASNGGSYHFGNATCRKKWDELVTEGRV